MSSISSKPLPSIPLSTQIPSSNKSTKSDQSSRVITSKPLPNPMIYVAESTARSGPTQGSHRTISSGDKFNGDKLNAIRKIDTIALTCLQIKEFAKIAKVRLERAVQSLGKTTGDIVVIEKKISSETDKIFENFKSFIDDFTLELKEGEAKPPGEEEVMEALGDNLKTLFAGIKHPERKPITKEREKFIDHLKQVQSNTHNQRTGEKPNPNTISMKELLGKDGMKMYLDAVKEEKGSTSYRMAVFAQSMQKFEGPTWEGQVITYIGGPSGGGKSFATKAAMKEISNSMQNQSEVPGVKEEGNDVIAIDGGIERQASKMRSLVLQIALSKGFDGIEDLQDLTDNKMTGPKIKNHIEAAALAKGLNLVIPNTFVEDPAGAVEKMKKLHKLNIKQRFVEVVGEDPHVFRDTTRRQAGSRAYLPGGNPGAPISITNLETKCESKKYEDEVFDAGVNLSHKTMEHFQLITGEKAIIFKSDRMYVKEETHVMREGNSTVQVKFIRKALPSDPTIDLEDPTKNLVAISKAQYLSYVNSGETRGLEEWLKDQAVKRESEIVKARENKTPESSEAVEKVLNRLEDEVNQSLLTSRRQNLKL